MRRKTTVHASRIEFLSPQDCDSTIGYKITSGKYLNAQMSLTDCNRKIEWFFEANDDALEKIDKILEIAASFREELIEAQRQFRSRRK